MGLARLCSASVTAALAIAALVPPAAADTWSSTAPVVPIVPSVHPVSVSKDLVVDGTFKIRDVDVILTLQHPHTAQLELTLRHPDGTLVTLLSGVPGTAFTHTVLDDEAAGPPSGGSPYSGSFRPASPLSILDDKPAAGTWSLAVTANSSSGTGELRCFSLAFNGVTYAAGDVKPIFFALPLESSVSVADDFVVADADVTVTLDHTYPGDLNIRLRSPEAVTISLFSPPQGLGWAGLRGTTSDDEAPSSEMFVGFDPNLLGRFAPPESSIGLSAVDGHGAAGVWALTIQDVDPEDNGTLRAWSLHLVPETTCSSEAAWSNYGAGLAGTLGVPALTSDDPVLGETVHLQLGNSSGVLSPALLMGGFATAALPFKGGTLLVAPSFQVALLLPPTTLTLGAALPAFTSLCGQHVDLQLLQADAGAPNGVSLSAGLDLLLGS